MSRVPDLKPVVVTRAETSDGPLTRELKSLGLPTLLWPAVSVTPADPGPLTAALAAVRSFGWIVFASRNAVAAVLERLPAAPAGVRVAALGKASAQVLRQRGWPVDLVPHEANAAALIATFAAQWQPSDAGVRVLYPASSRALPTIAAGLTQLARLSRELYDQAVATHAAYLQARSLASSLAEGSAARTQLDSLAPPPVRGGGRRGGFGRRGGAGGATPTLNGASDALLAAAMAMQSADVTPTAAEIAAADRARAQASTVMARWNSLKNAKPVGQ